MCVRVCMCLSVLVYARAHVCVFECTCVRTHMRVCVAPYTVLSGSWGGLSLSKRLHTFVYRKDNDVCFNFQLIQHILLIR